MKNGLNQVGNTHTHARFSDENDINDMPMIAGWYKEAGYNFLLLSEHNDHVANKKIFSHDEAAEPPDFIMISGPELSNERHHTALGIDSYIGDELYVRAKITNSDGKAAWTQPIFINYYF